MGSHLGAGSPPFSRRALDQSRGFVPHDADLISSATASARLNGHKLDRLPGTKDDVCRSIRNDSEWLERAETKKKSRIRAPSSAVFMPPCQLSFGRSGPDSHESSSEVQRDLVDEFAYHVSKYLST